MILTMARMYSIGRSMAIAAWAILVLVHCIFLTVVLLCAPAYLSDDPMRSF